MTQNRLKSPVLWAGVLGLVALVAKNWFGVEIPGWDEITTAVLGILAVVGVVNNPTDKVGW